MLHAKCMTLVLVLEVRVVAKVVLFEGERKFCRISARGRMKIR